MSDGVPIAEFRTFDTEFFGLTVDALTTGALGVDGLIERPGAIQHDAHLSTAFPIDIFDTAPALDELVMLARLPGGSGMQERTLEALAAIAVGMVELDGWNHAVLHRATRSGIRVTGEGLMSVLIERHGSNPAMTGGSFVDIPGIEGSIGGDVGGILSQCKHGPLIHGTKVGHIVLIEGLSVFSEDDIAIVGGEGGSDARAVAPEILFDFFGGAISLFLIAAAFDAKCAVGITGGLLVGVKTVFDVLPWIVFFAPCRRCA